MKKILEMKPIRTPASDLREDIFATILKYLGRDYILMMACDWGLRIKSNGSFDKLATYIDLEREYVDICLKEHIGISGEKLEVKEMDEFKEQVHCEIDKSLPVIIHVSTIGLSYHRTYNDPETAHIHQILVIGYDENNVYFFDVPWSLEVLQLSWNAAYELLDKEAYNLEHIQIDDEKNTFGVVQMLDMLISKVTRVDEHGNMFDSIRLLASLVDSKFDIYKETDGKEFTAESLRFNPFIFGIDTIGRRRLTMVDTCNYVAETYKIAEFYELAELFQNISQEWIRLRYILIKGCCKGGDAIVAAKKNVGDRIREIAEKEEYILKYIIDLKYKIENQLCLMEGSIVEKKELTNNTYVEVIDITKYFNNCAFHNTKNELRANLNVSKTEYYISDAVPPATVLEKDNLKFLMPDIYNEVYDNICCCGQVIEPVNDVYISVMVMGFAALKGYAGVLRLVFLDGSEEEINIAFSNSSSYKPLYGEKVALQTKFYSRNEYVDGFIFCNEYTISQRKQLKNIVLPDWEMFSVMAISLRKEKA